MDGNTSIGPAVTDQSDSTKATVEGVDAQNANEFDVRRGLAGAEAKPFSPKATTSPQAAEARPTRKQGNHEAASSQPANDPNRANPNERSDMISERQSPGRHGGGGDPAWKPSP